MLEEEIFENSGACQSVKEIKKSPQDRLKEVVQGKWPVERTGGSGMEMDMDRNKGFHRVTAGELLTKFKTSSKLVLVNILVVKIFSSIKTYIVQI